MERDLAPVVSLHVDPLSMHSWSILCGLTLLHDAGEITLKFRDLGVDDEEHTLLADVQFGELPPRRVALAIGDSGRTELTMRERDADFVFRRSCRSGDGTIPLGILFSAETGSERLGIYLIQSAIRAAKRRNVSGPRRTVSALRRGARYPKLDIYEARESRPLSGRVLFQVRAWDPEDGRDPDDREDVNEVRADLIRALRSHLGDRFIGGFVRSPFAEAHYGDLLSKESTSRVDYLRLIRGVDIGISTTGLHGSVPRKIPEYLAAGKAIFSEPLQYDVGPDPKDVIQEFHSVESCLGRVDLLLSDPARLAEAQNRSTTYWTNHVRPDQVMRRMLGVVRDS